MLKVFKPAETISLFWIINPQDDFFFLNLHTIIVTVRFDLNSIIPNIFHVYSYVIIINMK